MNRNPTRWLLFAGVVLVFGVACSTTPSPDVGVEITEDICTGRTDPSCEGEVVGPDELFERCVNSISSGLAPDIRRRLEMRCERLLKE